VAGLTTEADVSAGAIESGSRRPEPLLCELHAHTTWSDGVLTTRELVDLYGAHGFDVLCVTDHVVRADDPMPFSITADNWHAYVNELEREAERARRAYGLLLIPGLELTDNRLNADDSAHALAIGLRRFVSMEAGIVAALHDVRAAGAAIIAAHPYAPGDETPHRATRRFQREFDEFHGLVDRWELFNRREVFSWVARRDLPSVASGDFHRAEHLSSWKSLLGCDHDEQSVIEFLRSSRPAHLLPFSAARSPALATAA
jgi:predicted metal-dependent phosphoesterase TrpH